MVLFRLRKSHTLGIDSPLQNIAIELKDGLEYAHNALQFNQLDSNHFKSLNTQVETIAKNFPSSFGDRFLFDYYMLQSIAEDWNRNGQKLSTVIIPRYDKEWSHISNHSPFNSSQGQAKTINFVSFHGAEKIEDIDLLNYPFLCHELGHNLFFYDDSIFKENFENELSGIIGSLRLRSIADHGAAKAKAQNTIATIKELWNPIPSQKNWAHETAMDLIALWTCGPAYLAAFQDELEAKEKNPYFIDPVHPPYALRVKALIMAGEKLGWQKYTHKLENILQQWKRSKWQSELNNFYYTLTDAKLVDSCVAVTLLTCERIRLPLCDKKMVNGINEKLHHKQSLEWGTELIIAAWLVHEEYGEDQYEKWDFATVSEKLNSLTP